MKRVYLILTLFITSFFFVSINTVSAATYELEVSESDFEYLTEDFYKLRELTINYSNEYEKYYVITTYLDSSNKAVLGSYIFDKASTCQVTSASITSPTIIYIPSITCSNDTNYLTLFSLSEDKESLVEISTKSSHIFYFRSSVSGSTGYFSLRLFLDNNIDSFSYSKSSIYLIKYNDLTYEISKSNIQVPSLYQIYLDSNVVVDPYEEEKEMINNFYSTIVNKIGTLATSFASNYIFLLIFGIFILIFVFELIRRRFI